MSLVGLMLTPNEQFYVIAKAYSQIKYETGICPANLTQIGRELHLKPEEIQSLRLKANEWIAKRGIPTGVDDKGWVLPTPAEERRHARPIAA